MKKSLVSGLSFGQQKITTITYFQIGQYLFGFKIHARFS